jgi:hypothetical protein
MNPSLMNMQPISRTPGESKRLGSTVPLPTPPAASWPARPLASSRPFNLQKWLRKLHAWAGLALSGVFLLFAVTGFLLNHRAVLKIPALQRQEIRELMPVPRAPASPEAMQASVLAALGLEGGSRRMVVEPAREVNWDGRAVQQPARWTLHHDTPSLSTRVEYWVGTDRAEIVRTRPNLWLHFARLHMSVGTGSAWTVLADAVALSLAALALSGFWLWGRLHGGRARLAVIAFGGAGTTLLLGLMAG